MGTRAVFTFHDEHARFSVYKHFDGYPRHAISLIEKTHALARGRYEAGEFAAAFVAINKKPGDDIRLSKGAENHGDLSYVYEITARDHVLQIIAFAVSNHYEECVCQASLQPLFEGTLEEAGIWARDQ
jgi:hypothetical protein